MIRPGDRLENPVTGEVLIFHRTAEETGGKSVLVEVIVRPHGFVAAAHVHPFQTERFEILEGRLGLRVDGKELEAGPGDVAVVPPGTPHRFWNAGEDEARFQCEVSPALQFESLIETMFTLAAEGKTNRKGMPNPFQLAVIARAHLDTVRLPFPPALLQRAGLALGAPVGRLLGYSERLTPAAATA
jgi:quercetin dioxygenase-like cupin family protein